MKKIYSLQENKNTVHIFDCEDEHLLCSSNVSVIDHLCKKKILKVFGKDNEAKKIYLDKFSTIIYSAMLHDNPEYRNKDQKVFNICGRCISELYSAHRMEYTNK